MQLQDFIRKYSLPQFTLDSGEGSWHKLESDTFKGGYIYKTAKYGDATVTIVTVHNWKSGESVTERFGGEELSDKQNKALAKLLKAQEEEALREKQRKHEEVKKYAKEQYALSEETRSGDDEYLKAKGLGFSDYVVRRRTNLLRQSELLLPMADILGETWNYQSITANGEKQIIIGGRMQGLFIPILPSGYSVSDLSSFNILYICEGFSTGLSIFHALDQKVAVLCAISSTNLYNVVREVRGKYERTPYVICADNDCWKSDEENSGERAAIEAVSRVDGGSYVLPDFSRLSETERSSKPTDFNDLFCLRGVDEVRGQIGTATINRPHVIYPLGYVGKSFFFTTSKVSQVQSVSEFSETDVLRLGSKEYWTRRFPNKQLDSFVLQDVKSDLIQKSQEVGVFDIARVRGRGLYEESTGFVLHKGSKLLHLKDWREQDLSEIESYYIYDPKAETKLETATPESSLIPTMLASLEEFAWSDKSDAIMLLGWMLTAPLSGCLAWRPHMAITSEAGTGKSTMLECVTKVMRSFAPLMSTNITEAGLRQSLGSDAIPVILDEVDSNSFDEKSFDKLMTLFRMASSGGEVIKGTPNGRSLRYIAQFSGIIAGVNLPVMKHADRTRFCILNMTVKNRGVWEEKKKIIDFLNRPSTSAQFTKYVLDNIEGMLGKMEELRPAIEMKFDARTAQQYGAILGSVAYALNWEVSKIVDLLEKYSDRESLKEETIGSNDTDSCVAWLLDMPVYMDSDRMRVSVGKVLEGIENADEILKQAGLRLINKKLFIPNSSLFLKRHFQETPWLNWNKTLFRVEGAAKITARINGTMARGILLPFEAKVVEERF